jgi:hypothetical protein
MIHLCRKAIFPGRSLVNTNLKTQNGNIALRDQLRKNFFESGCLHDDMHLMKEITNSRKVSSRNKTGISISKVFFPPKEEKYSTFPKYFRVLNTVTDNVQNMSNIKKETKHCALKGWAMDNVRISSHLTKNKIYFRKSVV